MVIVFEDLTHLFKAQKVAAWKEVAQGIAHEIKKPLTPIQLNTQRLKKKYYENREDFARVFDESINIISQEVESMKELLNEFIRFSRMPTPNPKLTSLHKIIDEKNLIRIEFSDNGAGISSADQEKLFLPHFTTKKRGTGLGLAIVNRIIFDHNGTIKFQDNYPKGTCFIIDLPYSQTTLEVKKSIPKIFLDIP